MSAGTVGKTGAGTMIIRILPGGPALQYHVIGSQKVALAITGLVGGGCGHDDEHSAADARRLAACWNACEGVSTEDIEAAMVNTGPLLANKLTECDQLREAAIQSGEAFDQLRAEHAEMRSMRDATQAMVEEAYTLLADVLDRDDRTLNSLKHMFAVPASTTSPRAERIRALLTGGAA